VKTLLGTGRIHGDLSAYNVLLAAKGPTIIDMPQVVDVAGNNNARQILRRDLRNLTEHLARFDARLLRFADCGDGLFHHLLRGTLDMVAAPEVGAPQGRGGGGRRGRDAERERAGRDKGRRPEAVPPPKRPGGFAPQVAALPGGPSRGAARFVAAPAGGQAHPGPIPQHPAAAAGAGRRRRRRHRF
jgi:hypothetical protein